VEIRPVRPEEYEEAGRVTRLAYEEFNDPGDDDWEDYLRRVADVSGRAPLMPVLVAAEEDRILGSATLEVGDGIGDDPLEPGTANLRMLGVDPGARGRGVGRALVEACIEWTRDAGLDAITLHTTALMTAAHQLYASMGFVRDTARDWDVTPTFTLYAYRLNLEPVADGRVRRTSER
jgi:GNAT superfamily N-acetyltransferase